MFIYSVQIFCTEYLYVFLVVYIVYAWLNSLMYVEINSYNHIIVSKHANLIAHDHMLPPMCRYISDNPLVILILICVFVVLLSIE